MALRAQYRGVCNYCNRYIEVGDAIARPTPSSKYVHEMCINRFAQNAQSSQNTKIHTDITTATSSTITTTNEVAQAAGESKMSETSDAIRKVLGPMADLLAPMIEEQIGSKTDENRVAAMIAESQTAQDQIHSALHDAMRDEMKRLAQREPVTVQVKHGKLTLAIISRVHFMFPKLAYLYKIRKHAYLWGAPGGGKSTVARQLAESLGIPFGYISLDPYTPSSHLIGYKDANGTYHATEFYRRYTKGGIFCIDEADNASGALLTTLNSALENGLGAFPCGMVKQHPDFVCVATGNTAGRGATKRHADRRVFDAAFAERFKFLEWGYDENLELAIARDINSHAAYGIFNWIKQVRDLAAKRYPALVVSPRATFGIAQFALDSGWTREEIIDCVLFKGLELTQKNAILTECPPQWPCTPASEIEQDDIVETVTEKIEAEAAEEDQSEAVA